MNFRNRRIETKTNTHPKLQSLSFKDRLSALQNVPGFFKLVWQTSPGMTLLSAFLRIIRSAIPLAILYVGKLIIDEVVVLHAGKGSLSNASLWKWVAIEFALVILSDILSRSISLLDGLLGDLFANHSSVRIMAHAATLDLDQFEDSVFYDKLERARQQTAGRTILLSQVMSQVQDIITMIFLAAGLVAFNPWLILLLLVAVVPAFLGEAHFNDRSYALTRGQTPERRELDYLRYIGASDETAKEVKIFNLSRFIIDRFRQLSGKFYTDNKKLAFKRSGWGTIFAMIGSVGYYGAYVFILLRAVSGSLSIGDLTFLAGSFRQMRSLLEAILNRFTAISQSAVYLGDFF
ncbi:MAG: ABC transporter ATP-binding protein, partial [Ferruginibacter sp.]